MMGRTASSYLLLSLIGISFLADVHGHLQGKGKKKEDEANHNDDHKEGKNNYDKGHDDGNKKNGNHDHHRNDEHRDDHKHNHEKHPGHHGHTDIEKLKEEAKKEFLEILKDLKEKLVKNCGKDDYGKDRTHSHRDDEDEHGGRYSHRDRDDEGSHNKGSGEGKDDHKSGTHVHHHHYHYADVTKPHNGHSSDHSSKGVDHNRDDHHDRNIGFHRSKHVHHHEHDGHHGSNRGSHNDQGHHGMDGYYDHHANHGNYGRHNDNHGDYGHPNNQGSYVHDSYDRKGNEHHGNGYGVGSVGNGDYRSKDVYHGQLKSGPQDHGNSNGMHVHHYYGVDKAGQETQHRNIYPQGHNSDEGARQDTPTEIVRERTHYDRRVDSWRPQPQNHGNDAPTHYYNYYGREAQHVSQPQHDQVVQRETSNQPKISQGPVAHVRHHHDHVLWVEDQNSQNQPHRIDTSSSGSQLPAHQSVYNIPMDIAALLNIPAPPQPTCFGIKQPPQTPVCDESHVHVPQSPSNKPKEDKPVYMVCMQKTLETQCDPPRIDLPKVEPACPPLRRDPCINSYVLQPQPSNVYKNPC